MKDLSFDYLVNTRGFLQVGAFPEDHDEQLFDAYIALAFQGSIYFLTPSLACRCWQAAAAIVK